MSHDLVSAMPLVAEALLGKPTSKLNGGRKLRYGKQGSLEIILDKGVFEDYENGEKGGTLALIKHIKGFDTKAAFEWMRSVGIDIGDDRKPNGHAKPSGLNGHHVNGAAKAAPAYSTTKAPERKIAAVYRYEDRDGALLYEVVRYEPKTFAQRIAAPGHPGAWIWSIHKGTFVRHDRGKDWYAATDERTLAKGWGDPITIHEDTPHGLFNFPEIMDEMAQPPDERRAIYIPEGERDCLTLGGWGLLATTNSGGAANWRADHAAYLAGADVVLLLDNDKAGRERGAKLTESLLDAKARVKVLDWKEWWLNAPEKADVTDWRDQAGGTKEKLLDIVDRLKLAARAKERRFGRLSLSEIRNREIKAPDYVVEDWLVAREVSFIGGPPQSGKTFLATHLALCIATGREVLGRKVKGGLVIYQIGESGSGFLDQRIPSWLQYYGGGLGDNVPFEVLPKRVDLFNEDGDTKALIDTIKSICREYPGVPLRAVFIDTFAKASRGADEVSGKDVGKVMEHVEAIASQTGAHVCVIHHIPVNGGKLRGHTSLSGDVDTVVFVESDPETKIRTIAADKIKDGPLWKLSFELPAQVIGHRPDGKEITSCVVVPLGEKQQAKDVLRRGCFNPSDKEEKVFRAFLNAMKEHGVPPPTTAQIPASVQQVITIQQWRDEFIALDRDPAEETAKEMRRIRTALSRAVYALTEKVQPKVVGRYRRSGLDDLVWHTGTPVRGFRETWARPKTEKEKSGGDGPADGFSDEQLEF